MPADPDACGVPVVAGPVEATPLGNVFVQARALCALSGGLHELRRRTRPVEPLQRNEPGSHAAAWRDAGDRLSDQVSRLRSSLSNRLES